MNRKIILVLAVVVLIATLFVPILACGRTAPPDVQATAETEQAQYTICVNACSQRTGTTEGCGAECSR